VKNFKIVFTSHNQAVLIGRFMLIFSRRRIDVTNYTFQKNNETEATFEIFFNTDEWQARNLLKQLQKQIDIFEAELVNI
jgi:hypothetical protein